MKNDKFLELIHKELDGVLEPSEQKKLESHLAENQEARQVRRELSRVAEFLSQAESSEPPAYLKKRILNSLPSGKYPGLSAAGKFRAKVSTFTKPGLKFAYVFAAGVVAGLILFSTLWKVQNPDDSKLTGAMLSELSRYDLKTADRIDIAEEQVSGTLETQVGPGLVSVAVRLEAADGEMSIDLNYNAGALHIRSFDNSDGALTAVESGDGLIKLEGSRVAGRIVFVRKSGISSPIAVRISVGPDVIERSLAIIPR